jgi:hypothetical protein
LLSVDSEKRQGMRGISTKALSLMISVPCKEGLSVTTK